MCDSVGYGDRVLETVVEGSICVSWIMDPIFEGTV